MQSRAIWAVVIIANLGVLLLATSADAYIQNDVTMKQILARTQFIFTAKVETFDPGKRIAVFTVDEHLKGKAPFQKISVALLADREGQREYSRPSHLLKRLATDLPVVFFADSKEGAFAPIRRGNMVLFLYVNGTWVQFAGVTTDDRQTNLPIAFHHFEPYLQRTFKGTTEEMRQVIVDGLSGKKDPPPHNSKEPGGLGPEIKK